MTALDYLGRPEALRREIAREKDRIDSLRELCTRVSARLRKVTVRSSPDPARMQDLIARIADGEQELRRLEEDLRQALADTALYISSLPDERMIRVLELRYLEGLSWEQTSQVMGYCRAGVFRYQQEALLLLPPPPADPEETFA